MTIERKVGMGIAGQPSGGATDVAEVFSTYLYTGTGSAQTINNGIDLAGEGGIVWIKDRGTASFSDNTVSHDGAGFMQTHATYGTSVSSQYISAFNSNGFNVGTSRSESSHDYASWTFRKKKKFFDIVTYTGNGVAGREIAHGLGGPVGMMLVKATSAANGWNSYHISLGATYSTTLSSSNASYVSTTSWNSTAPTSTEFTLGTNTNTNASGISYVAYLFADNSSEDAEDQMIECGSYTGNGSVTGPVVNLGWEPQFVLIKSADGSDAWGLYDSMRGLPEGTGNSASKRLLEPNSSNPEVGTNSGISVDPTGFHVTGVGGKTNDNNYQYIYMAIRAPMMVEPEAATDVFAIDTQTTGSPNYTSSFVTDAFLRAYILGSASYPMMMSRLTGTKNLITSSTAAEATTASYQWDFMDGFGDGIGGTSTDVLGYMWKRAKGYMDVVAYTGDGGTNHSINHSLAVTPEMVWFKKRNGTGNWLVYHKDLQSQAYLWLHDNNAAGSPTDYFGTSSFDSTSVYLGSYSAVNGSGISAIAYLFATLAGISKVGSYTGNGSNQTIDCGFSAGSRFILIKRTDATGDWFFWDSARGIVAGNDPHLSLNTTAAQVTNDDSVDPHNSGFIVNQVSATNINVSSGTYIFYAIA